MVTIDDVARHAGVSSSTVSYVFSGKRSISEPTRQRVEASVRELGYRPNAKARALASRRSQALALVAPLRADNNVPVMMQYVSSIATHARERDHDILLVTQEEGRSGVERVGQSSLVDGFILMDLVDNDPSLPLLNEYGIPFVLIGQSKGAESHSLVDLDIKAAAQTLVDHMVDLGHTELCLVGMAPAVYERGASYALRFKEGYEERVNERGLSSHVLPTETSYAGAQESLERHLDEHPETTAFVVHNEGILGAVISVLNRRGLRVPDDVSVAALCPEDLAITQRVELTNVEIPTALIGGAAVDILLKHVEGDSTSEARLFAPKLTERASSGPPRVS